MPQIRNDNYHILAQIIKEDAVSDHNVKLKIRIKGDQKLDNRGGYDTISFHPWDYDRQLEIS